MCLMGAILLSMIFSCGVVVLGPTSMDDLKQLPFFMHQRNKIRLRCNIEHTYHGTPLCVPIYKAVARSRKILHCSNQHSCKFTKAVVLGYHGDPYEGNTAHSSSTHIYHIYLSTFCTSLFVSLTVHFDRTVLAG